MPYLALKREFRPFSPQISIMFPVLRLPATHSSE